MESIGHCQSRDIHWRWTVQNKPIEIPYGTCYYWKQTQIHRHFIGKSCQYIHVFDLQAALLPLQFKQGDRTDGKLTSMPIAFTIQFCYWL